MDLPPCTTSWATSPDPPMTHSQLPLVPGKLGRASQSWGMLEPLGKAESRDGQSSGRLFPGVGAMATGRNWNWQPSLGCTTCPAGRAGAGGTLTSTVWAGRDWKDVLSLSPWCDEEEFPVGAELIVNYKVKPSTPKQENSTGSNTCIQYNRRAPTPLGTGRASEASSLVLAELRPPPDILMRIEPLSSQRETAAAAEPASCNRNTGYLLRL